jgi:phosphopantothenoylcysteine decarboxylase/phosphopantothenate--cysteine ligase
MACGEFGPGRMREPADIFTVIAKFFDNPPGRKAAAGSLPLSGRRVLITAGPTHEPIDPVRYIANRSSGRQGYALAQAAVRLGAHVSLVSGPVNLPVPPGVEVIPVETAREMMAAVQEELPCDIAIFCAAVADWRTKDGASRKIKKDSSGDVPKLELVENPDILKTIGHLKAKQRPALVVGFAAETDNVVSNAQKKLKAKGADLIVANDVSADEGVMGGHENTVHLVVPNGVESWKKMDKQMVAAKLMQHFAKLLETDD